MAWQSFYIPTLDRPHGAAQAESAVRTLPGILRVKCDVSRRQVDVEYREERVDAEQMRAALTRAGFDVLHRPRP